MVSARAMCGKGCLCMSHVVGRMPQSVGNRTAAPWFDTGQATPVSAADPVDPYKTDRAYWRLFWHQPAASE